MWSGCEHSSARKKGFMEPINGMRYYKDVHRQKDEDLISDTGDVCESESDAEASDSSDSGVIVPTMARSRVANRAAAKRKSSRQKKGVKKSAKKRVSKKRKTNQSSEVATVGHMRSVQEDMDDDDPNGRREASYEDLMKGVQQAGESGRIERLGAKTNTISANGFKPVHLMSEEGSVPAGNVAKTTEPDAHDTASDRDCPASSAGIFSGGEITFPDGVAQTTASHAELENKFDRDGLSRDDNNAKKSTGKPTRYKISPGTNPPALFCILPAFLHQSSSLLPRAP
nr:hypothetical protein B0A51_00924 [Rachicladosporium sp. CCFEE 5018]